MMFGQRMPRGVLLLGAGIVLLIGTAACGGAEDASPSADGVPTQTPRAAASPATPSPAPMTPSPVASPVVIDDALWKHVQAEGTVMVIVTLSVPFQPESQLSGQAAIDAQRVAIANAQDELVASLSGGQVEVVTRMNVLPQMVLIVDESALQQLASSPLVLAVQENTQDSPTGWRTTHQGGRL